ncbi:hypothetical protein [Streptomyces sp. CAU 1734]|uniref:hypothetical protein n=1 Tax=Streptomyces sp. CAU 1734 TaxID=3140360 RepID=UPI003261C618
MLTRLQIPASKALALAAMPTAVFVGMGLAPRPALAEEKDIPFAPGPCVTRSEEPADPSPSPDPSPDPSSDPSASPSPSPSAGVPGGPSADPPGRTPAAPSGDPSAGPSGSPSGDPTGGKPEPSPSKSGNPLDPLGLGAVIKDLVTGTGGSAGSPAAPSPAVPSPAGQDAGPGAASGKPSAKPSGTPSPKPPGKPGKTGEPGRPDAEPEPESGRTEQAEKAERAEKEIREAAGKAGAEVAELPEEAKGLDPRKDRDIPDGAKPRFPCPVPDPEALAAAEEESGIPLLADDPWILESSVLTLRGLSYHGIVEVRTGSGTVKPVLKFTASKVDIGDLHQLAKGPLGTTLHVEAARGSNSTISDGTVTMYTEELKGNLFGVFPVTFSPRTPPPLDIPVAVFTDVRVVQAGQFGGTLAIPRMRNYVTGAGAGG